MLKNDLNAPVGWVNQILASFKTKPKPISIIRQLTSRVTLTVVATVLFGGLPAIGAIWLLFNQQIDARLQDTLRVTQAFYIAESERWEDVIGMVGESPTWCSLLQRWDQAEITAFIHTLRINTPANGMLVLDREGHIVMDGISAPANLVTLLDGQTRHFVETVQLTNPSRLAILAASPIDASGECEDISGGWVMVLKDLDQAYMQHLAGHTGLEQSLILDGQRVASSLIDAPPTPLNQHLAEQVRLTLVLQTARDSERQWDYFIGMAPLSDSRGQAVALIEVALAGEAINRNILAIMALFVSAGLLIALFSTLAARQFTRRLTQPLVDMALAAERISRGELGDPIPTNSDWLEYHQLATQLEASRRHLKEMLQVSYNETRQVRQLLNVIREGILTLDESGCVTWLNSDASRILGYRMEALYRKHYRQIFRPAPGEGLHLDGLFETMNEPPLPGVIRILDGKDQPLTLEITISRLPDESKNGQVGERVLVIRDVSQEENSMHTRAKVLGSLAHEFRTPLSSINAATELMAESGSNLTAEELVELVKSTQLSTLHLQTLVDNLLESARMESGFFHLSRRPVHIREVVQTVLEMLVPLLERREQQILVEQESDLPVLWIDPERVKQVLINLIANASKYSPAGSSITLTVQRQQTGLYIAVTDHGPGLPAASFEDLFARFYTGDKRSGPQYGVGLGLSVVKTIVEAHQGQVGAHNQPEGGAQVWFTLPLKKPEG